MRNLLSALMITSLVLLFGCQAASSSSAAKTENASEVATKDKEAPNDLKTSDSAKTDDGHDHTAEGEAKRISLADAKSAFDKGEAFFIDTRSANAFENEHIEGAINIPSSKVDDRYKEVPKDKTVIVYCS